MSSTENGYETKLYANTDFPCKRRVLTSSSTPSITGLRAYKCAISYSRMKKILFLAIEHKGGKLPYAPNNAQVSPEMIQLPENAQGLLQWFNDAIHGKLEM